MPQLTLTVAIGSVLTLTGPGGVPIPMLPVHLVHAGDRNIPMDVPTLVWALGNPAVDSGRVDVTWSLPAGDYEVAILPPAINPRTPARGVERLAFTVKDNRADLEASLAAMLDELAQLETRIDAVRQRLAQPAVGE